MTPIFWEDELFCWVVTSAHQTDLGGVVPGSFCQTATDIFHDPIPLPPFKIVNAGKVDVLMEELYRRHSRTPVHLSLDLRSAIAGNNHTKRIIHRLIEKYGAETIKSSMQKIIDTGEQAFLEKLRKIPDGTWREHVFMESVVTPTHAHWMFNVISGTTQEGEFFIGPMLDGVLGSTGATPYRDGRGGDGWVGCPTAQGPNVEFYEQNWPILYLYRKEQTDSAGPGKWRGGSGGIIAYTPHKGNISLATATVYGIPKTHGILGGYPGTRNETRILRGTNVREQFAAGKAPESIDELGGEIEALVDKEPPATLDPNDVVDWWWCSTGGYGDPIDRDPNLVAADVRSKEVSVSMAEKAYGVVLDEASSVNLDETETKRRQIGDERLANATITKENTAREADGQGADGRIGDYVNIKSGEASCARCDQGFGPVNENFKQSLAVEETSVTEAGPLFVDPGLYVDDDRIRLYRFCCPNCAAQLSITAARTDDEMLGEFELARYAEAADKRH